MTEPRGERGRQGAAPLGGMTPGPWEASRRYSHAVRWLVHPAGRPQWSVSSIPHGGPTQHERHDADARLIAAAPEMLAALQLAVDDHVGTAEDCEDDCWSHVARAALAKARGEQ